MTTNKTFLTLLLLGLSYTAYNAAAVSENFAISTTIDHEITLGNFRAASADANLDVKGDINLGTIYINPIYSGDPTTWGYTDSGIIGYNNQGAIIRADNQSVGFFTANIANPEACNTATNSCGGLEVFGGYRSAVYPFGSGGEKWCHSYIKYSGEGNLFKVFLSHCYLDTVSDIIPATRTASLTITYTPS
ncbi:MAG: hypothetical protein IJ689_00385 [Alphaproteobacteria bacterium]|nr:hypothetical protein [Alphaproteobacteria bacterium]